MAITKRQRELNDSLFRNRNGEAEAPRYSWSLETRKLIGGEWVRVGHFQEFDTEAMDRHASAMGGEVKLVRKKDGEALARWNDGARVDVARGAEK